MEVKKNDFIFFQNEVLKDLKNLENKMIEKISGLSKKLNTESAKNNEQFTLQNNKIVEIINKSSSSIEQTKINNQIEKLKKKFEDYSVVNNTKVNSIQKELTENTFKFDKIFITNLTSPGLIGPSCTYTTVRQFLEYVNRKIKDLEDIKDKQNKDIQMYKEKLETLIGQFKLVTDSAYQKYTLYCNELLEKSEKKNEEKYLAMEERVSNMRVENGQYSFNLIKKSEELKVEWEGLREMKKEIFNRLDMALTDLKNENKLLIREFDLYKKDHKLVKSKLNELSDFIKDVRFRNGLKNLSDLKASKVFKDMSKNMKFKRSSTKTIMEDTLNDTDLKKENLTTNENNKNCESINVTNNNDSNINSNNNKTISNENLKIVRIKSVTSLSGKPKESNEKQNINENINLNNNIDIVYIKKKDPKTGTFKDIDNLKIIRSSSNKQNTIASNNLENKHNDFITIRNGSSLQKLNNKLKNKTNYKTKSINNNYWQDKANNSFTFLDPNSTHEDKNLFLTKTDRNYYKKRIDHKLMNFSSKSKYSMSKEIIYQQISANDTPNKSKKNKNNIIFKKYDKNSDFSDSKDIISPLNINSESYNSLPGNFTKKYNLFNRDKKEKSPLSMLKKINLRINNKINFNEVDKLPFEYLTHINNRSKLNNNQKQSFDGDKFNRINETSNLTNIEDLYYKVSKTNYAINNLYINLNNKFNNISIKMNNLANEIYSFIYGRKLINKKYFKDTNYVKINIPHILSNNPKINLDYKSKSLNSKDYNINSNNHINFEEQKINSKDLLQKLDSFLIKKFKEKY